MAKLYQKKGGIMNIRVELEGLLKKRFKGIGEDKFVPSASFIDDLGADSVDTIELVMDVEEYFAIDITDEELEGMRTIEDAITLIWKKKTGNDINASRN